MRKTLMSLMAPIVSMLILTLGNGFFTTLTTLQLKQSDTAVWVIGWVAAAYFVGLLAGAYYIQHLVKRIGHVRSYAVLASVITVATLVQGVFVSPVLWVVTRFLVGFAMSGLFVVVEGWILAASDKTNSGRIFAVYLLLYYLMQAVSQWFLQITYQNPLMAFGLIAGLSSLSILPVCLANAAVPAVERARSVSAWVVVRHAPLGMATIFISGMLLSIVYPLYPLYLSLIGLSDHQIATVMAVTIVGGALLQYPVGKWSDHMDRRKVLGLVSLITGLLAIWIVLIGPAYTRLLIASFLFGGISFTIFPLAISLTNDRFHNRMALSIMTVLNIMYGIGSAIGPPIASGVVQLVGTSGVMWSMAVLAATLALYSLWSLLR